MSDLFPILIDLDTALPVYAQIERQMKMLLACGYWDTGEKVPSVREMAVRLRVNPLTVHKVYRRLIEDGFLASRPGAGVYAAEPKRGKKERMRIAREALDGAVQEAVSLGLEDEAIEEIVTRAVRRVRKKVRK